MILIKGFLAFWECYLSVFSTRFIRMDFSKHLMKAEFYGYQRKEDHMLK
jgi:hypothetical protein